MACFLQEAISNLIRTYRDLLLLLWDLFLFNAILNSSFHCQKTGAVLEKINHSMLRFLRNLENLVPCFPSCVGRSNEKQCFSVRIWPLKYLFIPVLIRKHLYSLIYTFKNSHLKKYFSSIFSEQTVTFTILAVHWILARGVWARGKEAVRRH